MNANLKRHDRLLTRAHQLAVSHMPGEAMMRISKRLSQVASLAEMDLAARDRVNVEYAVRRIQRWLPLPAFCLRRFARRVMGWYMKGGEVPCRCITWTTALELADWPAVIDLVKIDIEGVELPLLRSMHPFTGIRQIIVEIHDPKEAGEAELLLTNAGFTIKTRSAPLMPELPLIYARKEGVS